MSASRQLMKWSPQVHQDILIATFCNLSLSSEQWAKVMADLSKMGYTFSENALRQHVQKLRKARDTNGIVTAADPSAAGTSKASATPRKAAATPRKRKTPIKEIEEDDEDDDVKLKLEQAAEDDGMDSPSIRPSKRARPSASSLDNGFGSLPNPDEI
ncbi:hypothetical protein ACHAPE_005323 [Trichoderma viride]